MIDERQVANEKPPHARDGFSFLISCALDVERVF